MQTAETANPTPPEISSPKPPETLLPNHATASILPQPPSFASLFKENRNLAKCVALDSSVECEEGDTIVALDEDLLSIEEAFGHALLGFVIGGVASPRLIHALIKSWNVPCTFSTHHNGWILFKFGTKVEMLKVLENGPYSILGRQWMIKEVPKYFSFKDSCFSSVPIWVNLKFLPKQCWSKALLSRIAKKIGKPIAMDVVTGDKSKHDGARLLVEVDLAKPIVDKVSITMPDGRIWDQMVDYDIKPFVCAKCNELGHKEDDCKPKAAPNNYQPRGRSIGRRGRSKKPAVSIVMPRVDSDKLSSSTLLDKPSTSTLSALANDKGKGKVDEVEVTILESVQGVAVESSKEWQLVLSKKHSPLPCTRGTVSPPITPGDKVINPRASDLLNELLPISPNSFAHLFDEDERALIDNGRVEAVPSEVAVLGAVKNTRGRPGKGVKEEDLRRSGRRHRAFSSS